MVCHLVLLMSNCVDLTAGDVLRDYIEARALRGFCAAAYPRRSNNDVPEGKSMPTSASRPPARAARWLVLGALASAGPLAAQAPRAVPAGEVIGVGNFAHIV